MNQPTDGNGSSAAQPDGNPAAEDCARRRWNGWLTLIVLLASALATAIVIFAFVATPYYSSPELFPPLLYTFMASLAASTTGSIALAVRKKKLRWLLTLPWMISLVALLFELSRAMGLASMH